MKSKTPSTREGLSGLEYDPYWDKTGARLAMHSKSLLGNYVVYAWYGVLGLPISRRTEFAIFASEYLDTSNVGRKKERKNNQQLNRSLHTPYTVETEVINPFQYPLC